MIVPLPERSPDFGPETPETEWHEHLLRMCWHERRVYAPGSYGRRLYTNSARHRARSLRIARRAA